MIFRSVAYLLLILHPPSPLPPVFLYAPQTQSAVLLVFVCLPKVGACVCVSSSVNLDYHQFVHFAKCCSIQFVHERRSVQNIKLIKFSATNFRPVDAQHPTTTTNNTECMMCKHVITSSSEAHNLWIYVVSHLVLWINENAVRKFMKSTE